jgi:hypothetical protein
MSEIPTFIPLDVPAIAKSTIIEGKPMNDIGSSKWSFVPLVFCRYNGNRIESVSIIYKLLVMIVIYCCSSPLYCEMLKNVR